MRALWTLVTLVTVGALALAACGLTPVGVEREESAGDGSASDAPAAAGQLVSAEVERAAPTGAELDTLVSGMTGFGVELYAEVAEPGANVVLSPASVAVVFGMARAGAQGTTARQIDEVLGFPEEPATTHASFNALDRLLAEAAPAELAEPRPDATRSPDGGGPPALAIANGVFPQVGFPIHEEYLSTLAAQYGAGVVPVDFADPSRAKEIIDGWVQEQTRDRIEKLFDELDPETKLVLANAVYLKADWLVPFAEYPTEQLPFTLADGEQVQVSTMRRLGELRWAEGEGWRAVELPYVGERLAMLVLVPTGDGAPADLLTPDVLRAARQGLARGTVDLHLPRWDFDTNVALVPAMRALGMQAPFILGEADFSGIADAPLYISDAIHRARITVDEWGTEAAAVTGLGFVASGPPQPDVTIHADRPFAFVIHETTTSTPVFLGQVANPSA